MFTRIAGGVVLAAILGFGGAQADEPARFVLERPGSSPLTAIRDVDPAPEISTCDGAVLLVGGQDVECLDTKTGASRWRKAFAAMTGGVRFVGGGGGFVVLAPKTGPTWTCVAAADGAVVAASVDTAMVAEAADADAQGLAVLSSDPKLPPSGSVRAMDLSYRPWTPGAEGEHPWSVQVEIQLGPRPLALTSRSVVVPVTGCGLAFHSRDGHGKPSYVSRLFEYADPGDGRSLAPSTECGAGRIMAGPFRTAERVLVWCERDSEGSVQVVVSREVPGPGRSPTRYVALQIQDSQVVRAREIDARPVGPGLALGDAVIWQCEGESIFRTVSRADAFASKGNQAPEVRLPLDLVRDWTPGFAWPLREWGLATLAPRRAFFENRISLVTDDRKALILGTAEFGGDIERWRITVPPDWVDKAGTREAFLLSPPGVSGVVAVGPRLLVTVRRRSFVAKERLLEFDLSR